MSNRRTFLTTLGTAILTVSAGCASENPSEEEIMSELTDVKRLSGSGSGLGGPRADVIRYIDREAGVVLYSELEGAGAGVTAIPLSDTNLR